MVKLSAKFLLGTSTVIEKVGLLSYFGFLARTSTRIRLNMFQKSNTRKCLRTMICQGKIPGVSKKYRLCLLFKFLIVFYCSQSVNKLIRF